MWCLVCSFAAAAAADTGGAVPAPPWWAVALIVAPVFIAVGFLILAGRTDAGDGEDGAGG